MGVPEKEKRGRLGGRSTNPYQEDKKYAEPTMCPRCGLQYHQGRWQSLHTEPEGKAQSSHCPACRRELDRYPDGVVRLRGAYLARHRDEILSIARNQASAAAEKRPLQRIMWIEAQDGETEIATTNGHLAVRIGRAIEQACKGTLDVKHGQGAHLVRVYWERNT